MLPHPLRNHARHVPPPHVNVRVPLRIVRAQEPEREQDVAFDEVDVDEIHRYRIGGGGGGGEPDAGLEGVGDAVECNGGVDGVIAVGTGVVGRRVARRELNVVVAFPQRHLPVAADGKEVVLIYVVSSSAFWLKRADGLVKGERLLRGGPELGHLLVDDLEEPLGDAEGHVLDGAEAAGEGTDGVGGVDREGTLEDVESEGAGVDEHHARHVGSVSVGDHVRQHLVLQPGKDAVLAWVWGAVGPVVPRGAAKGLVELQGFAG